MRVRNEAVYPRERGEKVEKGHPAKLGKQMPNRGIHALEARPLQLPESRRLLAIIAAHPAFMSRVRKSRGERGRAYRAEEVVEHGVREGTRLLVRVLDRFCTRFQRSAFEEERTC